MAYRNLDEFLARLEQEGHVAAGGASAGESKVGVFRASTGSTRIVRSLFGTRRRVEMALRVKSLDLIAERLDPLLELGQPGAFSTMIGQAMSMFTSLRVTQNRRAPQSYQHVEPADWRVDLLAEMKRAGADAIAGLLMTGGATSALRPVRVYLSDTEIAVESAPHLPVGTPAALVFGGDPALLIAALTPLPDLLHRSYLASWLRERPLDMMRLPALDFDIPANIEAAVIGKVASGGVGDGNAYLDPDRARLVIDAAAVYTNGNAIYLDWTPAERDAVREALFTVFRPALRRLLPGLDDDRIRQFIGSIAVQYLMARDSVVRRTEA